MYFLIDNKDDVPKGVQIEIDTVNKYQIPSLYYFCQGEEKEKPKRNWIYGNQRNQNTQLSTLLANLLRNALYIQQMMYY